jgi:hypothetical protein
MRRATTATTAMMVLLVSAGAFAGAPAFIGVEKCKPCHMPEFGTWSASAHAAAAATARAGDAFTPECLKCHGTNAAETSAGVECEACHGPGSEYWPIPVMIDKATAVKKGLLIQGQPLCDGCHDGQDHHAKVEFGKFKHDHREKKAAVDAQ